MTWSAPTDGWWVPLTTGMFAVAITVTSVIPRTSLLRRSGWVLIALSTTVHEGGHALASVVTGGGVRLIKVTRPDAGITYTWAKSRFSSIVTTAAGYAAPPLAGLGAARLISEHHAPMVLGFTVAAALLFLLVSRDLPTLGTVLMIGAGAAAVLYWGQGWLANWVATGEAWLLLLGEIGGLWAIVINRIRSRATEDDAASLAAKTGIPALVWIIVWSVVLVWSTWAAVPLLWEA